MSCHHVCRRCAATFEPEGHEVVSLRARVAEARAEREAERAAWQGYADAWHTIEEAFDHVDHAELDAKHTPEQARDFIRAVLAERDRLREYVGRLEAALMEYAVASDRYCDAGEPQSRYYGAQNAVLVLGREIQGRKP